MADDKHSDYHSHVLVALDASDGVIFRCAASVCSERLLHQTLAGPVAEGGLRGDPVAAAATQQRRALAGQQAARHQDAVRGGARVLRVLDARVRHQHGVAVRLPRRVPRAGQRRHQLVPPAQLLLGLLQPHHLLLHELGLQAVVPGRLRLPQDAVATRPEPRHHARGAALHVMSGHAPGLWAAGGAHLGAAVTEAAQRPTSGRRALGGGQTAARGRGWWCGLDSLEER